MMRRPASPLEIGDGDGRAAVLLPIEDAVSPLPGVVREEGEVIVRSIASFLTFSDVASLASLGGGGGGGAGHGHTMILDAEDDNDEDVITPADSWVVGGDLYDTGADSSWSVATPPTPALVALSPGATPAHFGSYHARHRRHDEDDDDDDDDDDEDDERDEEAFEHVLQERRRKWAQEKLAAAVFCHPQPLRCFCLEAYAAAQEIRIQQQKQRLLLEKNKGGDTDDDPETWIEPCSKQQAKATAQQQPQKQRSRFDIRLLFLHDLVDLLFHNVPLSVFFDVTDVLVGLSLDTSYASFRLAVVTINGTISALGHAARVVWDAILNFNPFQLLEAIISLQFNAMGKTSEVLVSGIQSVATGVGSASSLALHRLSTANLSISVISYPGGAAAVDNTNASATDTSSRLHHHHATKMQTALNKKLLKKMSHLNDAARVVSYMEVGDETGGLTRHAISRTRRMMHYKSISLRPFVATVAGKPSQMEGVVAAATTTTRSEQRAGHGFDNTNVGDDVYYNINNLMEQRGSPEESSTSTSTLGSRSSPNEKSPYICSPQSFPPTPRSRQMVLERGSQFADDVVFLARDRLRIHDGLESGNERTREMAWALREGKRLAIFDGSGVTGIELSCGQHIATKVGTTMYYASTRSMVPVLRNCYVYFEITVMPRMHHDLDVQASPVTLSVGLSTAEMPPNTLVGAWQGSIGLCTTGQTFVAGQWLGLGSPDPSMSAYGPNATVGCLVFLDDSSAFETWDGVMVNTSVTFSINGVLVPPPLSTLPLPGAAAERGSGSNSSHSQMRRKTPTTSYTMPTLLVPASEELYPTVTLQTPATAVMCRFSGEDVISRRNIDIGAPEDATVYAVDGSVICCPENQS